jgi:hypothetical protein
MNLNLDVVVCNVIFEFYVIFYLYCAYGWTTELKVCIPGITYLRNAAESLTAVKKQLAFHPRLILLSNMLAPS